MYRDLCQQVLRLTLLTPQIVEAILDGRLPQSCSSMICWPGFSWHGRTSVLTWLTVPNCRKMVPSAVRTECESVAAPISTRYETSVLLTMIGTANKD